MEEPMMETVVDTVSNADLLDALQTISHQLIEFQHGQLVACGLLLGVGVILVLAVMFR